MPGFKRYSRDMQLHDAFVRGGGFCPCAACHKQRLNYGGAATDSQKPQQTKPLGSRLAVESNRAAAERVLGKAERCLG